MDFNASLRRAIKTGNVILGQNNTEKCIKEGKAQMIVVAGNCPAAFKSKLSGYENLFIHTFEGSSVLLARRAVNPSWLARLLLLPRANQIFSRLRGYDMVEVKLTEDCMRLISQFESLTGAGSRDCVVDERNARLIFVINPGDMGLAIGKKGASIKKASEVMGKKIEVVEYNSNPEQFIKNCFLPAQVTSIIFEGEPEEQTVQVEVTG